MDCMLFWFKKIEYCLWATIVWHLHYHQWTASIKQRLLFPPYKLCFRSTFPFSQINTNTLVSSIYHDNVDTKYVTQLLWQKATFLFTYSNKVIGGPLASLVLEIQGVEPLKQRVVETKMDVGLLPNRVSKVTWKRSI